LLAPFGRASLGYGTTPHLALALGRKGSDTWLLGPWKPKILRTGVQPMW
jgi:hypothetical protein